MKSKIIDGNDNSIHKKGPCCRFGVFEMKRFGYYILSLSISAGALIILVYIAGFENLRRNIEHISIQALLLVISVYSISWIFRTRRLSVFVNRYGVSIRPITLFKLSISGFALNNILPAKLGDGATIAYLRIFGIKLGRSAAIILQTRVLDLLSLILIVLSANIFSLKNSFPAWTIKTIFVCSIICLLPYSFIWFQKIHNLSGILKKYANRVNRVPLQYVFEKASEINQAYSDIVYDKKLFLSSFFVSVLIWAIEGLSCYIIARSIGANVPITIIFFAMALANIGKALPVTPGGIGIYESLMVAVLTFHGLQMGTSLAIALCDHLSKKIFTVSIGIPATFSILGYSFSNFNKILKTPLSLQND